MVDTKAHSGRIGLVTARSATLAALISLCVVGGARLLALDSFLLRQIIEETAEVGDIGGGSHGHGALDVVKLRHLDTVARL